MKAIRLAVGMQVNGSVYLGECIAVNAPTDMEALFSSLILHKDQNKLEKFFLENNDADPCLFNWVGVWASPTKIGSFKNIENLMRHFTGDYHNGVVTLIFMEGEWKIYSRVEEHLTDGFVSLHEELAQFYTQKYPTELIENIFKHEDFPLIIDSIENFGDTDVVQLSTLYFDHPAHLSYEDNYHMDAVEYDDCLECIHEE